MSQIYFRNGNTSKIYEKKIQKIDLNNFKNKNKLIFAIGLKRIQNDNIITYQAFPLKILKKDKWIDTNICVYNIAQIKRTSQGIFAVAYSPSGYLGLKKWDGMKYVDTNLHINYNISETSQGIFAFGASGVYKLDKNNFWERIDNFETSTMVETSQGIFAGSSNPTKGVKKLNNDILEDTNYISGGLTGKGIVETSQGIFLMSNDGSGIKILNGTNWEDTNIVTRTNFITETSQGIFAQVVGANPVSVSKWNPITSEWDRTYLNDNGTIIEIFSFEFVKETSQGIFGGLSKWNKETFQWETLPSNFERYSKNGANCLVETSQGIFAGYQSGNGYYPNGILKLNLDTNEWERTNLTTWTINNITETSQGIFAGLTGWSENNSGLLKLNTDTSEWEVTCSNSDTWCVVEV